MDVVTFASGVRPHGFDEPAAFVEMIETSVAIGLQNAGEAAQVLSGMLALEKCTA